MRDIETRLESIRKDKGLKQKDIARLFGTTPENVSNRLTNGTYSFLEIEKILNLCGYRIEIIKDYEIKK